MKDFKNLILIQKNSLLKLSLITVLVLQALLGISQFSEFNITAISGDRYRITALNTSGNVMTSRTSHDGFVPSGVYNAALDRYSIVWDNGPHLKAAVFNGSNGFSLASRGAGDDLTPTVQFNEILQRFAIVYDNGTLTQPIYQLEYITSNYNPTKTASSKN